MDSPVYAMLFAEDLLKSFLDINGFERPSKYTVLPHRKEISKTRLTPQICEAVKLLMLEHKQEIDTCYQNLVELKVHNMDDFRLEVSVTMVYTFQKGFNHEKFLEMCALLVGISLRYAKVGNFDIADASAQVLAYILNFYIYTMEFDPKGDWFQLSYQAQLVRRRLPHLDLERTTWPNVLFGFDECEDL